MTQNYFLKRISRRGKFSIKKRLKNRTRAALKIISFGIGTVFGKKPFIIGPRTFWKRSAIFVRRVTNQNQRNNVIYFVLFVSPNQLTPKKVLSILAPLFRSSKKFNLCNFAEVTQYNNILIEDDLEIIHLVCITYAYLRCKSKINIAKSIIYFRCLQVFIDKTLKKARSEMLAENIPHIPHENLSGILRDYC